MSPTNMDTLMLHRTILILALITGAVHSKANIYWSKGAGVIRQGPGQYQGQQFSKETEAKIKPSLQMEETKRFDIETRDYPLSTIVRNKEFKRRETTVETTVEKSKTKEIPTLHFLPFSTIITYRE